MPSQSEVIIVHSSDLHLGTDSAFPPISRPLSPLSEVLAAATALRADVVLLAGDTFDHNRQPSQLLEQVARAMGEFGAPIVILPGNHDPLTPDSAYRRVDWSKVPNVFVLGLTVEQTVSFPHLELEIWGKAHRDYADMSPLFEPRPRSTRWRLAAVHGHYVEEPHEPGRLLGSWLIRQEDLIAADADYVALGHWNRAARVGNGQVHAYYSGSPDFTGTVNIVRLSQDGAVYVTQAPVRA